MRENGKNPPPTFEDFEVTLHERAEDIMEMVLRITKEHGVCFLRFTKEDGMVVIRPQYNSKLNGVIADA